MALQDPAAVRAPAYASSATRRLAEARNWFIFNARPPHVPSIVWNQLSDATRSEHRRWLVRLKHADPEIAQLPIWPSGCPAVISSPATLKLPKNNHHKTNVHLQPPPKVVQQQQQLAHRRLFEKHSKNNSITEDDICKTLLEYCINITIPEFTKLRAALLEKRCDGAGYRRRWANCCCCASSGWLKMNVQISAGAALSL
eukprot:PhM_4_TR2000/c0_g1_i1/m.3104